MDNRTLIKSVIAANDQGVYSKEVRDEKGEILEPKVLLQAPIRIAKDAVVAYSADLKTKILTVIINGVSKQLPIDDYSLALAEKVKSTTP